MPGAGRSPRRPSSLSTPSAIPRAVSGRCPSRWTRCCVLAIGSPVRVGADEIDADLDGGRFAATSGRGLTDGEVDPDVRCAGREGQARHIENRDALTGQRGAVDRVDVRSCVGLGEPGEDAVASHQARRGDGRPALQVRDSRRSAGVGVVEGDTDTNRVDAVELARGLQCGENDDSRHQVAGDQNRCRTRPLRARDDLRADVEQAAGDAEVGQSVVLCVVQAVESVVPQCRDHRRVGGIGETEIAARQIDRDSGRGAEFVGHTLRPAEIATRDGQRQGRIPAAQQGGGVRPRLPRTAHDQYRFLHGEFLSGRKLQFVTYSL